MIILMKCILLVCWYLNFSLIIHLFVLNCKISSKQITIKHNFIKYLYSYMFHPSWIIIKADF